MEPPDVPEPESGWGNLPYMIGCAIVIIACGAAAALFIWAIKHA